MPPCTRWSAAGPGCAKTKSDLVVTPSGGRIFAFFCFERDHKPQNSGCGYTVQSFHTAWATSRLPRCKKWWQEVAAPGEMQPVPMRPRPRYAARIAVTRRCGAPRRRPSGSRARLRARGRLAPCSGSMSPMRSDGARLRRLGGRSPRTTSRRRGCGKSWPPRSRAAWARRSVRRRKPAFCNGCSGIEPASNALEKAGQPLSVSSSNSGPHFGPQFANFGLGGHRAS